MTSDAVTLAGNTHHHFEPASKSQYPDVFRDSKSVNKPFNKFTENTIKGTHFKTGVDNTFHPVSENATKFAATAPNSGNNKLP